MSGESIPSGALKVAELLNEARVEGDARYTLRTSAVAFTKGAEFALNLARRDLASPSPATGTLSDGPGTPKYRFSRLLDELEKRFPDPAPFSASLPEPRHLAMLDAALSSAKREAKPLTMTQKSYLFVQACDVKYMVWDDFIAGLEAAEAHHGITAAAQVEPEDKP